ncbi:inner membrane complex protein 1f, putative [Plasmodium ovale]|uniref:Inner membrane complex protein 1f, putative n=1 Tax=Plasmodium ovale TaxID=36330 RepID=A0A1C3KUQ4_PLAOA|nr:inner membrane complex protein 1f, putative [Plasmodium ovale]
MLKNTTKTDRTKREQNRILLEKKLSKDSVTSTKFCDSSEDREEGSNSSSHVSLNILEESNITQTLDADKTNSFICDKKGQSKGGSSKSSKKNLQKSSKVNTLDRGNDTNLFNNIQQAKSRRTSINLDESKICSKASSSKAEVHTDNQRDFMNNSRKRENIDVLNIEENIKKTNVGEEVEHISCDTITKRLPRTISFKDNLFTPESNLYSNVNKNLPHFYFDNKAEPYSTGFSNYNQSTVLNSSPNTYSHLNTGYNIRSYNDTYLDAAGDPSLKYYSNGSLSPRDSSLNPYGGRLSPHYGSVMPQGSNWGMQLSNNFNLYENNNTAIDDNLKIPLSLSKSIEYTGTGAQTYNTTLDEAYNNRSITNEMDFTNMYSSYTPIGSNSSTKAIDSSNLVVNDNAYWPGKAGFYTNSVDENSALGTANWGTTVLNSESSPAENVLTGSMPLASMSTAHFGIEVDRKNFYDTNAMSGSASGGIPYVDSGVSAVADAAEASAYVDCKYTSHILNDPSENSKTVVKPSEVVENEEIKRNVSVCEKVSSHTDYSRATHSSHIIDKRIVHEGFDTIKIPKYREVEIVEKIVEVPVVHKVNKYINKYEIKEVEKVVKKPINKYVETKIEIPELHYQDKIVEVPELQEIVKIVEKPEVKERIIYKNKIETKIIPKYIEVPVVKIVNKYESYDDIGEVIKTVPVKKIVEIPNEVIKKVKVPIKKIVEQPNYVPVIKYRDVPIEKIRYVPKVQTIELVKKIPKVIDIPIPVKVPKVKIINKPFFINKYIDRPVVVPVAKTIKPVFKYEGKKLIEIPIHKPYIITHDTVVSRNIKNDMSNGRCAVYARRLDLNSFDPVKRNKLFNMVNQNNFNLHRSVSADNLMGSRHTADNYPVDHFKGLGEGNNNNDVFVQRNFSKPSCAEEDGFGFPFSADIRGDAHRGLGNSNYFPANVCESVPRHLNDNSNSLHFSKNLNKMRMHNTNFTSPQCDFYASSPPRDIPMCHSNAKIECVGTDHPFGHSAGLVGSYNGAGLRYDISPSRAVHSENHGKCPNGNVHQGTPFCNGGQGNEKRDDDLCGNNRGGSWTNEGDVGRVECSDSMQNLPHSNTMLERSSYSNENKKSMVNMNTFMDDDHLARCSSDDRGNVSYYRTNAYRNSSSLNRQDPNNTTFSARSRSPSACSVDGISAYVVEYVGDQDRRYTDAAYSSNGLSSRMVNEMGSNYTFNGEMANTNND